MKIYLSINNYKYLIKLQLKWSHGSKMLLNLQNSLPIFWHLFNLTLHNTASISIVILL